MAGGKVEAFHLDLYRLRDGAPVVEQRIETRKEQRRRKQFRMIPEATVEKMRGRDHVWTVLLHLEYLRYRDGNPVTVANALLEQMGISRDVKRKALLELERRGVVTITRRPRKSPTVWLVDA